MRRFILTVMLAASLSETGCLLPPYSGDPVQRTEELIYSSEGLRHFREEWQRFWFLDQPDHMTPFRTQGGII